MGKTILGVLLFAALPVFAQRNGTFRANIKNNGSSDSGKCTIEVRVDGTAEVEFGGETGRLRTLSGAPAQWTRIDCSNPMPRNMREFKFSGIDGRGRQNLVADPRGNGGIAVVRLDDPDNGSEGYTFDLEWKGGDNSYNSNNGNGYGNNGNDYDNNGSNRRGRGRRNNNSNSAYTVNCASDNGQRRQCNADTRNGVLLVRQYGNNCRQGETWGYDKQGIWVDRGCAGEFQVGR